MDKVYTSGRMENTIRDNGWMVLNMEWVTGQIIKVKRILVIGEIIKQMERVYILGQMVISMKVIGLTF